MARRVVTGHDALGRAVVASDEQVTAIPMGPAGSEAFVLWGRDDAASYPDDGSLPAFSGLFPPPGGCRASIITIAAGGSEEFNQFVSTAMAEYAEPGGPGMHRTPSLDFDIVLAGRLVLELDDGVEVELGPGDVVVQNGTRHRWHNRSGAPVTYATIVVGATGDFRS